MVAPSTGLITNGTTIWKINLNKFPIHENQPPRYWIGLVSWDWWDRCTPLTRTKVSQRFAQVVIIQNICIGFAWHQKYNFGMLIKHVSIFEYNKLPHLWCWKTKNNLISQWSDFPTSICWTSKKNLISQWWATWLSLSTKEQNILLWSSKYTQTGPGMQGSGLKQIKSTLPCIILGPRTHISPNWLGGRGFNVSTLTIWDSTPGASIPAEPVFRIPTLGFSRETIPQVSVIP